MKKKLKNTNKKFRKYLPETEMEKFANQMFKKNICAIFCGHFHQTFSYVDETGNFLETVPGWHDTNNILVFHHNTKHTEILPSSTI